MGTITIQEDHFTGDPNQYGTGASWQPRERMSIISAELIDGRIEIVKKYSSSIDYTPSPPDRIEKEIYGVISLFDRSEIVLIKTIPVYMV